jgi:hypothetical protein
MDAAQQQSDLLTRGFLSSARTNGALQHHSVIASSTRLLLVAEKWRRWQSTANEKMTMTILEQREQTRKRGREKAWHSSWVHLTSPWTPFARLVPMGRQLTV